METSSRTSTRVTVCAMLTGLSLAAWVLSGRGEFGLSDVTAEVDTANISAACTDPTAAGLVPAAAYTVTWVAPARASASTPSASMSLTSGINGESAPSVTAALSGGLVSLYNLSPKMKMAGLQCQALSGAKAEVHGDGTDNTSFDIAYGMANATSYQSANKVDAAPSTSKKVLAGATGALGVRTTPLVDGTDDEDGANNGEIVFGGVQTSNGATTTQISIDVTNYNVTAGTDVETLTYTLTSS